MACATLKRSLDWENLNQNPTKRRRCSWQTATPTNTTNNNVQHSSGSSHSRASSSAATTVPSAFNEAQITKISPEKMASDIRNEIKRLHKRKQLPFSADTAAAMERMQESESSGSEMGNSPRRPDSPPSIVRNPEKALFTFKQVQLICERMLKEREEEIREKYDAVLTTKLAEQYDAFVKFTYDQIQKRYDAAPSYLS